MSKLEQFKQQREQTETYHSDKLPSGNQTVSNFNYHITKFFLDNSRLTILLFLLLIVVGGVTTFLLKTTGFPNPEVGVASVSTSYLGASSSTIAREVSQPLENALKGVEGVDTYSSTSLNNFSRISVTLKQGQNTDNVINKIESAINSVKLPEGADKPKVEKLDIGGTDFVFSISANDLATTYSVAEKFRDDLNQLTETSKVSSPNELKKELKVTLNYEKMKTAGVSNEQVVSALKSVGEPSIPVSNQAIPLAQDSNSDNSVRNYILSTQTQSPSLEQLGDLQIRVTATNTPTTTTTSTNPTTNPAAPKIVKLSEIADLDWYYSFSNGNPPQIGLNQNDKAIVITPVVFNVKTVEGIQQSDYKKKVEEKIRSYSDVSFVQTEEQIELPENKAVIVENFAASTSNDEQVNEVVSGLIGGKLDISEPWGNVGWLLGGIQLVFLVMLAFVSWRAAVIAAASIPLSLVFSSIYLYIIGESLNTLVLFSLVLVIGLVVDPALVILESIQRKIDTGLKGKDAALAAVKDVGNGLFLATLTNIIVFLPFGLISGIIGQIFSYIPLTVIPATIGSYIVPLIFLAWLGGLILKPSKNKTADEEENLWGIAKSLIKLNMWILNSNVFIRIAIIVLGLAIPFGIVFYYTSSGQVRQVQFAENDNSREFLLSGSFTPGLTDQDKKETTSKVLEIIASNKEVKQLYPFALNGAQADLGYRGTFSDPKDRSVKTSIIADEINTEIQNKFGDSSNNKKFFDVSFKLLQTGGSSASYQVSIAVQTDDMSKMKTAAEEVGRQLQKACLNSERKVVLDDNCDGGKKLVAKIDDGFTGKENKTIEILLDRNKLLDNQLILPASPTSTSYVPTSILVNQRLKTLFQLNNGEKVTNINVNGQEYNLLIDKNEADPTTLEEIKNLVLTKSATGADIKLSDVAEIREVNAKSSILRVKSKTTGLVNARLVKGEDDQAVSSQVTQAVINHFKENDFEKTKALGLDKEAIIQYSEGQTASTQKSLVELLITLVLAIILTYVVLAVFFESLTLPLVVLYTIPLTFIGMYPALAYLGGGQIGFLEIIGIIILIGVVENVAIFLIDSARQKIKEENWDEKRAISYAAGLRLRPVLMTKFTAIASLAPLAILSVFYRSISIVIIFGLLTSGFVSLITTPILFIFFRWLSNQFHNLKIWNKVLIFIPVLTPFYIIGMAVRSRSNNRKK
ncbi:MAG: efflux RND transporter permease subunit [Patescibacteria group bacterium]